MDATSLRQDKKEKRSNSVQNISLILEYARNMQDNIN